MGVIINHVLSALLSPIMVGLLLVVAAIVLSWRGWRKLARALAMGGVLVIWVFSAGITYRWLGLGLEREFPPQRVEEMPSADAIVVLGGGVNGNTNTCPYAELYPASDRVAHAARLWKAGRAPVVILSGEGEAYASAPFLQELGVPTEAILVENAARNTEQNARFVAAFLKEKHSTLPLQLSTPTNSAVNLNLQPQPKILLVTSAWHMRRSMLLFRKYAPDLDIIPAACDYEATIGSDHPFDFSSLVPSADGLLRNSYMLKEYIGYWGYKLLR